MKYIFVQIRDFENVSTLKNHVIRLSPGTQFPKILLPRNDQIIRNTDLIFITTNDKAEQNSN